MFDKEIRRQIKYKNKWLFLLVYQKTTFRNEKWKNILYTIATKMVKYLRLKVIIKAKCPVEHNYKILQKI